MTLNAPEIPDSVPLQRDAIAGSSAAIASEVDVCIVNPWFYPLLVGPGERFRRYARGLRERGIRLRVVTVQHPGLEAREAVDGIEVHRIPIKRDERWRHRAFVYKTLAPLARGTYPADVVQLFVSNHWNVPFALALRALGFPTLLVYTMVSGERGRDGLRGSVRALYRRIVLAPFSRVVTSSGVMESELHRAGVSSGRIDVIPNGVDLHRFRPSEGEGSRRSVRKSLGLPESGEIVLFVGHISPRKGTDTLLSAWHRVAARHPDAHLVLVGGREGEDRYLDFHDRIDRLIETAPDPARIILPGATRNVSDYYRAADVFVFPSLREGMPNVVPEAMATGVPCVVTPFQGLPEEFGEPGREYLLAERAPEPLGDAVSRLLAEPDLRRELGARARRWVEERLDVEQSLDRFARVYRKMARKTRSNTRVNGGDYEKY